jgi:hypothetical protein
MGQVSKNVQKTDIRKAVSPLEDTMREAAPNSRKVKNVLIIKGFGIRVSWERTETSSFDGSTLDDER